MNIKTANGQESHKLDIINKMENLTWKDIKTIVNIADDMIDLDIQDKLPECCATEEGYYQEILNRFLKRKER